MKKLLSIICTLAIVLGVVLVPGMVSASAATTATFLDFNVTKTTMTDAGDGVYYVTGGWKDHYIFTDFEMQAGKTYNITMNVGIDHYSGGVRLEAATADFKCKNRTNIPYAKGNKVMDNIILSHTFNADDMIDGDYKYVAFNINCAEGSTTKNGVKNIRICEVPSNEGYANIRATYELGNWGVDSTGTWAFIGSAYYGWQNGQYDVEISPDKYYKIDYEYKGKSSRDGGRALGWSTTADGALSSGGSAIGATYVALPDQGVVVSEYKAYSQIVSGAALGATETNKYLTICGQNVLGAITHIRNVKVSELASAPFFTKFKGVTATYVETTESGNEYAYGIPANDTFGAGWGSDHYMTSEYVLEPNSTYIITYDWKGHNYSEPIWFTIMDEAGSNYKYRELLANISSKNAYVRQGSVLRTGSNVDDTYKYFGMMVKDYGTDPYLVKNVNITKVDEAALTTLLPSATRGNAFVAYDDVDGAYFWERGWNGNGSFTFDYVINPEDTYKISFHFKGANALGHAGDNEANYWALRTNTSTGKAGYTAGVGTKIDTIPAKDQSWGYFAYDFTFKGSDIGATTDSPYLVLQQGGYYATCYFKDIQIVNLSKTPADYSTVNAAIDAAGKLNKGNYVDFTAVDNAIAAVVEGKMAIDQAVVDGYAKAINDAVAALELKKADYSAVNDAVAEAQRIDSALYTNYAAVEDAVDAVVPGLDITKQAEVDAMAKAINDAIAALQYKPADYTDVEDAIADAELLDKNLYKDFTAVDNAVNAVVKDKNITEQDAVDAMAAAINNAIANLEFKDADYTAVQNAIAAANAIDADLYTNFIAVTAAIDAVDYTKNITEQAEVDAYAEAIYAAIEALEYKAADYSAVEEATAKAVALRPDADLYVNFQAVEDAVANVELGKNVTEQAEVDAMAKAINDALAALQYKPADYTSVEDAIAEAEKLNPEVYTNYQAVQDAIDAVEYGLDITKQSQVDAYAGAILAAIEDLEYSGANYDKVTAAIEAANKFDGELYTNWADVDAAIKAVVYGLDVTKQAEVDAMADAINNAVAALELKAADYAKVEAAIAAANAVENKDLYANYADVEAAIEAVVYGLDITKQAEVDAYAKAINDAVAALGYKAADYAKVEAAKAAAEAVENKERYLNWADVEAAIADVVYGLDITKQAEVDAYAKAINDAIEALVAAEAQVNDQKFVKLVDAIEAAEDGDTVTLLNDVTISDILVIDKSITLDGNEYKLTYTGAGSKARAINVSGAVDVTIKNLTIDAAKAQRAINVIQGAANVVIDNVTATSANYTVNVAASAANAVVAIKNSDLTGLNTVNVAAANSDITIDGTTITTVDNATTEGYSAICLNKDGKNGKIIATNTTVNLTGSSASDSKIARNGADGGYVSLNGSTDDVSVDVAYISYGENYYGFATLEAAIAKAKEGETIVLIRDVTVENSIVINKNIILDGDNKTITVTGEGDYTADGVGAAILSDCGFTLKNITVVGGARGVYVNAWNKDIKADVVLENVVILNSCRAFNVTGGLADNTYKLIVNGGEFAGKISWSGYMNAEFNGVKFSENESAKGNVIDLRANATFTDCIFADGYELSASDLKGGEVIKVVNTTVKAPANYEWVDGVLTIKDADYTAVQNAIDAANALDADLYTNFDAVTAAIAAVDYTKNITEQAEVDAYAEAILAAIDALELKAADYTAVEQVIADSKTFDATLYSNWADVEAAINDVVYGLDITKQAQVDAYAQAISDAINALKFKGADYAKVEAAIEAAEAINADLYDNYSVVEVAVKAVVYGLDITKQAEVDAMAKAINDAIAALQYKAADYTAVQNAIDAANALDADLYTNYKAVEDAIAAVVYGLDITKQAEVDAYAEAILAAIDALELKAADYTAVEEAIAAAEAVENKEIYSNWADVEAAINNVVYGLDITKQAEVDAYAGAILAAIEKLEVKGADYSKVNAAIAAANALNRNSYVDFTAVDNAIAAVVEGKKIEAQDEVDAWADAIYAAIDALVYREGIIEEGGKLYYIENGEKVAKGLVKEGDKFYYFSIDFYALEEGRYYLHADKLNGLIASNGVEFRAGFYNVNADCTVAEHKNGFVEEGGKLYYYEDDVKVAKGLVKDGDKFYYFGKDFYALEEGEYFLHADKLNGLIASNGVEFRAGFYTVNADRTVVEHKNGIVEEEGKLYYYEDDEKVAKGLVKDGNKFYYFGINFYALEEGEYFLHAEKLNGLTTPNGSALKDGFYTVNADNTVVIEDPKNGIVEEGGKLYYYEDGVKIAKGLVKDGDNYYYFGINLAALEEGQYWFSADKLNGLTGSDGEALEAGMYTVNADSTVVIA